MFTLVTYIVTTTTIYFTSKYILFSIRKHVILASSILFEDFPRDYFVGNFRHY